MAALAPSSIQIGGHVLRLHQGRSLVNGLDRPAWRDLPDRGGEGIREDEVALPVGLDSARSGNRRNLGDDSNVARRLEEEDGGARCPAAGLMSRERAPLGDDVIPGGDRDTLREGHDPAAGAGGQADRKARRKDGAQGATRPSKP